MARHDTGSQQTTFTQDLYAFLRHRLGARRGLFLAGAMVIVAALAINWSALVAAGVAPILIGVLPCAVMCGLGLCMHKLGGNSCASQTNDAEHPDDQPNIAHSDVDVESSDR